MDMTIAFSLTNIVPRSVAYKYHFFHEALFLSLFTSPKSEQLCLVTVRRRSSPTLCFYICQLLLYQFASFNQSSQAAWTPSINNYMNYSMARIMMAHSPELARTTCIIMVPSCHFMHNPPWMAGTILG